MKKLKIIKGQYGYIERQQKNSVFRTIFMFVLSFAIFLTGLWSTGTKENFLTIVAVLGCLPASRSAVNTIMFLRAKGCSALVKEQIEKHSYGLTQLYDMFFTAYDKNFRISHMVVQDHIVCGYAEDMKCDEKACEKHLDLLLKKGGCKNVAVKIYKNLENYCEGLENLQKRRNEVAQNESVQNEVVQNESVQNESDQNKSDQNKSDQNESDQNKVSQINETELMETILGNLLAIAL